MTLQEWTIARDAVVASANQCASCQAANGRNASTTTREVCPNHYNALYALGPCPAVTPNDERHQA